MQTAGLPPQYSQLGPNFLEAFVWCEVSDIAVFLAAERGKQTQREVDSYK